jgi:hypothetical protein
MKTNLDTLTGQTPLYMQYGGQHQPQDAYIEIHANGEIHFDYNSEIGNAVPMSVWHGQIRRIAIPNDLTSKGYADLFDYISDLLQILVDGMDDRWDGSNWVGTLTEEAQDTLDWLD